MDKKPIAIVLGGTNPHIALLQNLKKRGYYTVLIDYYENPPAKIAADQHIRESTLDQEKVLELARDLNAELVISACIDQANVTACYVAEKLGLTAPYSYETALNVSNKGLMKKKMLDYGIPTSKYLFTSDLSEFKDSGIEFPVVVKPSDSTGSKGVRKTNNFSEMRDNIEMALNISREKKVIIEEFIDGIEIQIDCFIQNKKVHLIMVRQKSKILSYNGSILQSFGSITPANISEKNKVEIQQIADKISLAYDLTNTTMFIQAIINEDGVKVIEFAPRVGGGLSYKLINLITGFDVLNATVNSYLNVSTKISYHIPENYYSTYLIYALPGIFGKITGYRDLIKKEIVEDFVFFKTKGMEIGSDLASRNRVGAFIVKGKNEKDLTRKIEIALNILEIYDLNGNPIMIKDLITK